MKNWIAGAAIALTALGTSVAAEGHGEYPERPVMLMVSY